GLSALRWRNVCADDSCEHRPQFRAPRHCLPDLNGPRVVIRFFPTRRSSDLVAFGCAGAFRIGLQSRVHVACIGPLQRRVDSLEAELVGLRSAPPEAPSLPEVEKRITPIESKIIPPGAIEDPPPATAPVAESGDH